MAAGLSKPRRGRSRRGLQQLSAFPRGFRMPSVKRFMLLRDGDGYTCSWVQHEPEGEAEMKVKIDYRITQDRCGIPMN